MKERKNRYTRFWKKNNKLTLFGAVFILVSCEMIQIKETVEINQENKALARVKDKYLYQSDVAGIVSRDAGAIDSANTVKRYIQNWVRKQLMISEAESSIEYDQAEIQRKMLDYRYALLVYEFEKLYINKNLNTEVSEEAIQEYYNQNKDKFKLKSNIVRGSFLQLPLESNKKNELKKLMNSRREKDQTRLRAQSLRFSTKSHLEDTIWFSYDDMFQHTPFYNQTNRVQFLKENEGKIIETTDDNFVYLFKIEEFKIQDETSPVEFVKDEIRNIIINKRKTELAAQLEEKIYNGAVNNKEFEIYVNE